MSKLSAKPIYGDPNRRRPADLAKRRLNVIASATLWKAPQRMRVRVIAAKNGSKPVERRRSGRRKGEAIRKNTVIIIALVRIFGGAPASLAGSHAETAKRRVISRGRAIVIRSTVTSCDIERASLDRSNQNTTWKNGSRRSARVSNDNPPKIPA